MSARQHTEALNKCFNLNLILSEFSVSNIVCSVETGFPTNLLTLKKLLGSRCRYEDPEYARRVHGKKEYSGARVRSKLKRANGSKSPKMTIFAPGNAVFMGCRNRMEIEQMCHELLEYLDMVESYSKSLVVRQAPVQWDDEEFFAEESDDEDDEFVLAAQNQIY